MSANPATTERLLWREQLQVVSSLMRGTRRLSFIYQCMDNGAYLAMALETATGDDAEGVLNDHGHLNLGEFKTAKAAKDACGKYAKVWLKKRKRDEACECEEIVP